MTELNASAEPDDYLRLGGAIRADDLERQRELIDADRFEVARAAQAFAADVVPLASFRPPATLPECRGVGTCTLATLTKYRGAQRARSIVELAVAVALPRFGKRRDLPAELLPELAGELLERYPGVHLAELTRILRDAPERLPEYSVDYGRLAAYVSARVADRDAELAERADAAHRARIGVHQHRVAGSADLPSLSVEALRAFGASPPRTGD